MFQTTNQIHNALWNVAHIEVFCLFSERPVVSGGFRPFGEDHYGEIHTRNRPSELNSGTPLHKKHVSGTPMLWSSLVCLIATKINQD